MLAKELTGQLSAAGLQNFALAPVHGKSTGEGGGSVVVMPHGARIMGLFTHDGGENLYFSNSEFASPAATKQMLTGEHFLGGDRLWLAPERGLNFKGNLEKDGYSNQRAIDPGNWIIAGRTNHSIRLVNEITAKYFHKPGSMVRAIIERSIRSIACPFAYAPAVVSLKNVQFAGYEIASRMQLLEAPTDDLYIGMWFLAQLAVKTPGYLYAPTYGKTVVTDYYEPTGPDYLKVTETHVRFKADSLQRHKIGIRKTEAAGRAGFLSNSADQATLVVRNFLVNPSADYADVPLHTPAGTQDAVQAYNHGSGGPDGFAELEFHSPGVNRAIPEPVVTDTNQLWAFTGARKDLVPIAVKLLGLAAETFAL